MTINILGKVITNETKSVVLDFYGSEENTYILPGLKDCIRYKNLEGNTVTEQKRLMLCSLKELYSLFKENYPTISIGFSTFAKLRPRYCLIAGSSGTHSVCVCPIHQNVKLLIAGKKL